MSPVYLMWAVAAALLLAVVALVWRLSKGRRDVVLPPSLSDGEPGAALPEPKADGRPPL